MAKRWILLALVLVGFDPPKLEAGAWTLPRGGNWLKIGLLYQNTTERYFLDGERTPYFFDGRNQTRALFFEYMRGLTDRWDVKVQIPLFGVSFDDIADERTTNGLGDVRVESRFQVVSDPLVLTVGGALKFPTGKFENDAEIVPVGQGQYDFDLFAEVGRSLWPLRGYVSGKIGYRWREANRETEIAFGDEILWQAEVGYSPTSRLRLKLLLRGLHGLETTSFGLPLESLKREVSYFEPGIAYRLTSKDEIELTVPMTFAGRNWPAGPVLNVNFSRSF